MEKTSDGKYIGLVKWFHDQARDANYGFIQHALLGDLFFHEKSIDSGQDLNTFRENEPVIFTSLQSVKHPGKLEAVKVKNLKTEDDTSFLFSQLLSILQERGRYSDYNKIQKVVHQRVSDLLEISIDKKVRTNLYSQYKSFINDQIELGTKANLMYSKGLLNICKNYFASEYKEISILIEPLLDIETAHALWMDRYIDKCQSDFISGFILSANNVTKQSIFTKCSEADQLIIFNKLLQRLEKDYKDLRLETIKSFIDFTIEYAGEKSQELLDATLNICPDYFKLGLWLEGYHETLDFNAYKLFTIALSPADQKRFVKKVVKFVHEGKAVVSCQELTTINLINFETSKLSEANGNEHLDYSTSIILNVIEELINNTKVETKKEARDAQIRIFELIIKQIKDPSDILEITGYFDECEGRCEVQFEEKKKPNGEIVDKIPRYIRNERNKPKQHPICDGRKAISKSDNSNAISEKHGVEFWWCANQPCYQPSRQLHSSDQWENYTLLDFLKIFKIQYKEKDLEIYLSLINKTNQFLKHLKCRKCHHILRPIRQSNYAFAGVNDFHCTNDACQEKGVRIYITHCLNGLCDHTIDSRDSVKCKPEGFDSEKCGWYVCNYCLSCCSDEVIERRISILERTGQEYRFHKNGHKNIGIISCNKCGSPIARNVRDVEEYEKVLKWFIKNKDNQSYIYKSGQGKNGKWWFLFRKNNLSPDDFRKKTTALIKLGFKIPDFDDSSKTMQLISEADIDAKINSEVYVCTNHDCGNVLDLSNDHEKYVAIKRFHDVFFKNN